MAEHPILFTGKMVRAILDGRKTQTRRIITPQPILDFKDGALHTAIFWRKWDFDEPNELVGSCPYGTVGDTIWVRECFRPYTCGYDSKIKVPIEYKADKFSTQSDIKWKPSIHMPRWAARIFLEITNIRVERVQDIDAVEAEAEGVRRPKRLCPDRHDEYILDRFQRLWDSINAKRGYGWSENPFVWVVEFKINS